MERLVKKTIEKRTRVRSHTLELDVDVCSSFFSVVTKHQGVFPRLVSGWPLEVECEVIPINVEVVFGERHFDPILVEDLGGQLPATGNSVRDYKQCGQFRNSSGAMSQMQRSAVTDKQHLAQIQSNGKWKGGQTNCLTCSLGPHSLFNLVDWIQLIPNHLRAYVCAYCEANHNRIQKACINSVNKKNFSDTPQTHSKNIVHLYVHC